MKLGGFSVLQLAISLSQAEAHQSSPRRLAFTPLSGTRAATRLGARIPDTHEREL